MLSALVRVLALSPLCLAPAHKPSSPCTLFFAYLHEMDGSDKMTFETVVPKSNQFSESRLGLVKKKKKESISEPKHWRF